MSENANCPTAVWRKRDDALHTVECGNCGADAHYQIVDGVWRYEPYCAHCGARVYKQEDLPMSENKKPRLAEVLGVEVGERFDITGDSFNPYYVDENGYLRDCDYSHRAFIIEELINYPDLIKHRPRWTEQEIQDAKNIIRLFGTEDFTYAMKDENGYPGLSDTDDFFTMGTIGLENNIFPSLKPGEFVKLDDIIGGNE